MRHKDRGHILLREGIAVRNRSGRGRRGRCIKRRCCTALDACVHVRLVVVAYVCYVVPALECARYAADTDIEGGTIACDDEHLCVGIAAGSECGLYPRRDCGRVFEERVDVRDPPRRFRVRGCEYLKAAGRTAHDAVAASAFENKLRCKRCPAPCAAAMSRCQ